MRKTSDYLVRHKEEIQLVFTVVVGIATIITSFVNVYLVKCQVDIYKEQNALQKSQSQPIFDISVRQQQDSDDGKYGTDILEVRNIGTKVRYCKVESTVFFCLSKHHLSQRDSLYAEIKDYFCATVNSNVGDGVIMQQWCPGNNRIFCEGYDEAMHDTRDGIYYYYVKFILLKIDYKDILDENHTQYYRENIQISEEQYNHYFDSASASWDVFFTLRDDIYKEMKNKIDKKNSEQ